MTFDPTNSIFEFCGVITYFCPCAAAGEATCDASPVLALVVSAAGSLHAVKNINPERIVIAKLSAHRAFPPLLYGNLIATTLR